MIAMIARREAFFKLKVRFMSLSKLFDQNQPICEVNDAVPRRGQAKHVVFPFARTQTRTTRCAYFTLHTIHVFAAGLNRRDNRMVDQRRGRHFAMPVFDEVGSKFIAAPSQPIALMLSLQIGRVKQDIGFSLCLSRGLAEIQCSGVSGGSHLFRQPLAAVGLSAFSTFKQATCGSRNTWRRRANTTR